MEEAEVLAGAGVAEGEGGHGGVVVDEAGGFEVEGRAGGVDEAHGPVGELALGEGLAVEDAGAVVAGVALDGAKDGFDAGLGAFEDLEEGTVVVEQHAGDGVEAVALAGAAEEFFEGFGGEGGGGGAGVDELEHEGRSRGWRLRVAFMCFV